MSTSPLGRTLVIANPAAHSGRGAQGATFAERFLASYSSATRGYELRLTTASGDAELMAAGGGYARMLETQARYYEDGAQEGQAPSRTLSRTEEGDGDAR